MLKLVAEYTGFSDDPEKQEGYYLAIKASVPGFDDVSIQVESEADVVALDSGDSFVIRVTDKSSQTIRVVASDGSISFSKTFSLNALDLEDSK